VRTPFQRILFLICSIILISSCQTKQEGAVEGAVVPPSSGARVIVSQSGKTVSTVDADKQTGTYRIALAPGKYDVSVSAPASPFPVNFAGVSVDPGKTAQLPPVHIAQLTGTAAIGGTVSPASSGTRITLFYEGQERASISASAGGKYEFTALPAGNYSVLATAPGYAGDRTDIRIAEDRSVLQNMRLLYVTPIDGIDWGREVIRAKGKGLYPTNATNHTALHEMAKRAAVSDAERNLLLIVEQIKLDPNHDLKSLLSGNTVAVKIRGFLQGFRIVAERELDNGVEVELEIPLTGPNGLTRYLSD
jgi:hypothetical protein